MKDAVGSSLLLYLVVIFTSIVILLFAGIISYSKAYKIKNRIIETIERQEIYDADTANELIEELRRAGYRSASASQITARCNQIKPNTLTDNYGVTAGYLYCVYEKGTPSNPISSIGGKVYEVVTFVHFDFPIIGDRLTIPVKGETKILGKKYNY